MGRLMLAQRLAARRASALSRFGAGIAGHVDGRHVFPIEKMGSSKGFIVAGGMRILAGCHQRTHRHALPECRTD